MPLDSFLVSSDLGLVGLDVLVIGTRELLSGALLHGVRLQAVHVVGVVGVGWSLLAKRRVVGELGGTLRSNERVLLEKMRVAPISSVLAFRLLGRGAPLEKKIKKNSDQTPAITFEVSVQTTRSTERERARSSVLGRCLPGCGYWSSEPDWP